MSQTNVHPYEGLFLFPQSAVTDLQGAVDHLKDILGRGEAKIISLRKWDERRLAYEIKGNKRGTYFLVYFMGRADQMTTIERMCNLSEQLLRSIIIRADHVSPEQMKAADGQAQLEDEIKRQSRESAPAAPDAPQGAAGEAAKPAPEEVPAASES